MKKISKELKLKYFVNILFASLFDSAEQVY